MVSPIQYLIRTWYFNIGDGIWMHSNGSDPIASKPKTLKQSLLHLYTVTNKFFATMQRHNH